MIFAYSANSIHEHHGFYHVWPRWRHHCYLPDRFHYNPLCIWIPRLSCWIPRTSQWAMELVASSRERQIITWIRITTTTSREVADSSSELSRMLRAGARQHPEVLKVARQGRIDEVCKRCILENQMDWSQGAWPLLRLISALYIPFKLSDTIERSFHLPPGRNVPFIFHYIAPSSFWGSAIARSTRRNTYPV